MNNCRRPGHCMETVAQSTQRAITVSAFMLIHARRPEIQCFSELLVQYDFGKPSVRRQVVPDNMIVIHPEPIKARTSYDIPLQPVKPFFVMESLSRSNKRKDYTDSYAKYEKELKVPYYLVFDPDEPKVTFYHLGRTGYRISKPNKQQRYPIEKLSLELGLHDGWVRYWYEGELLPLPADMDREVHELRDALSETRQELDEVEQERDRERRRSAELHDEIARLRAEMEEIRRGSGKS